jgi:hypothetical protein
MPMRVATLTILLVFAVCFPALAQDFRPNQALGEKLSKTPYIAQPANPGGKSILDNSCIYKESFSLSPNETVNKETCAVPAAVAKFTAQYGQPAASAPAPGGKTMLEYFLLFNNNSYHVKVFIGCEGAKTETFAMVECKVEKNRVRPELPKDKKPFWKSISPF